MADPLRHHHRHRSRGDFGDSLISRIASAAAEGVGTPAFLVIALVLIATWLIVNGGVGYFDHTWHRLVAGEQFDPPEWIGLNLIFSFEAFFTGSLVVIAAKAQVKRDRAREEADAKHRQELSDQQTRLLEENTRLTEQVHTLAREIHELVMPNGQAEPKREPPASG